MLNNEILEKREMWWVYSLPLARWLIQDGFTCYQTVPDLVRENHFNFLFKNSDELQESIKEYDAERLEKENKHD